MKKTNFKNLFVVMMAFAMFFTNISAFTKVSADAALSTKTVDKVQLEELRDFALDQLKEKYDAEIIGINEYIRLQVLMESATTVERLVELGADFSSKPEVPEYPGDISGIEVSDEDFAKLQAYALNQLKEKYDANIIGINEYIRLQVLMEGAKTVERLVEFGADFSAMPTLPEYPGDLPGIEVSKEDFAKLQAYALNQLKEKYDAHIIGINEYIRLQVLMESAKTVERLVEFGADFSAMPTLPEYPGDLPGIEVSEEDFAKLLGYALKQLKEKYDADIIGINEYIRYQVLMESATTVERLVELGADFSAMPELPEYPTDVPTIEVPKVELTDEQLVAIRGQASIELKGWIDNGELTPAEVTEIHQAMLKAKTLEDFIALGFFVRPELPEYPGDLPTIEVPKVELTEEQLVEIREQANKELAAWIENGELTQEEVAEIEKAILEAKTLEDFIALGFFIRPELPEYPGDEVVTPELDLSELEELVAEAKTFLDGDYTSETLEELQDAIDHAELIIVSVEGLTRMVVTQEDIDEAAERLTAAIDGLVLNDTNQPGTDKPGTDKPGTDKPGTDTETVKPNDKTEDKAKENKVPDTAVASTYVAYASVIALAIAALFVTRRKEEI